MIEIVRTDITTLEVDAIVNAANSALSGGGGVDGAIHRAAGPELVAVSRALGPIPAGEAVLTPGFRLHTRFVIHAVGPVWWGGERGETELLRQAYRRSFEIARAHGEIRSLAFPAISTGAYRFPKPLAAEIAIGAMREWETKFERIVACLFDEESAALYARILHGEDLSTNGAE